MCGSLSDPPAGQGWAVAAEREHGEGDERFGFVESEGHAGEQSNLGVGGLDEPVGQVVVERGVDGRPMLDDASLQLDEGGDAAAPGPAGPSVQRLLACLALDLEREP